LARSSEERMAEALGRISRGTYVPGTAYRPAAPSEGCGPADDFGRCSSRFHDAACESADLAAAASGGGESSDAWRRTLLRGAQISRELDVAYGELGRDEPGPVNEALMQELGLSCLARLAAGP